MTMEIAWSGLLGGLFGILLSVVYQGIIEVAIYKHDSRIEAIREMEGKCREQLIKMVELAEKQIEVIKLISDFTDTHLYPQIQEVEEAKKFLEESKEVE